jgi:acetylornithine deacetylase/succinyl-diaminopimelate desuccinylase-like protein
MIIAPMETAVADYLTRARDRHVVELSELLGIPSVSSASEHAPDIQAAARWLLGHLERIGLEDVRLLETGGNPIVYGQWLHADGAPTVLVYGHYDVQPSAPDELWDSPPFEPEVRAGRLYARGVTDNKGQIFAALAALEALLAVDGSLPCNVRVLIEGEEELSAENLTGFLTDNAGAEVLDADLALITDCGMYDERTPGVTTALRGMAACQFTLKTAASDLHSGVYGGVTPNAVLALAELLATLRDPDTGRVLVDGFYDHVRAIPEAEREAWASLPFDEQQLAAELGMPRLTGEPGYTALERMWGRPTLDVTGAWGGHTGEGLKTIIPAEGHATISCRLVPDQDANHVLDLVERHLRTHTPNGATLTMDWRLPGCWPVVVSTEHPAIGAALAAAEEGFGLPPAVYRAGYSVPIVELLSRIVGLDSVLLGFTLPDENMHAPNEFIRLDIFAGGVRTYAAFFGNLADGR